MTKPRKTLSNILKPEEKEFLESGEPTRAQPVSAPENSGETLPAMLTTDELLRILPAVPDNALSPLNVRISPLLVKGLKNAARIQEFQQKAPWTQRDIVSEALEEWLRGRGFLKGYITKRN